MIRLGTEEKLVALTATLNKVCGVDPESVRIIVRRLESALNGGATMCACENCRNAAVAARPTSPQRPAPDEAPTELHRLPALFRDVGENGVALDKACGLADDWLDRAAVQARFSSCNAAAVLAPHLDRLREAAQRYVDGARLLDKLRAANADVEAALRGGAVAPAVVVPVRLDELDGAVRAARFVVLDVVSRCGAVVLTSMVRQSLCDPDSPHRRATSGAGDPALYYGFRRTVKSCGWVGRHPPPISATYVGSASPVYDSYDVRNAAYAERLLGVAVSCVPHDDPVWTHALETLRQRVLATGAFAAVEIVDDLEHKALKMTGMRPDVAASCEAHW